MLKKIMAVALVGTALGCATFGELLASNGEEFQIKYSTDEKDKTAQDGKSLGFQREKKDGKNMDFAVLREYDSGANGSHKTFKVKGDKDKKGFRIRSTDDQQIFSYNQGSSPLKGGYYMWRVYETKNSNDLHKQAYYTRFVFDDKKQSLSAYIKTIDALGFSEYPLAIKEGKTGTQIYQKLMYNGMKNTRFCFIAKNKKGGDKDDKQVPDKGNKQVPDKGNKQVPDKGNEQVTDKGNEQVTDKGNEQVTDKGNDDGKNDDGSSAAFVGVFAALISLCIAN